MSSVGLQPASSKFARINARKTLEKAIKLSYIKRYLSDEDLDRLQKLHPDGEVYVWGVKCERVAQWAKMFSHDTLVLFRNGGRIYRRGVITHTILNDKLALHLWGPDEHGESWALVYFLTNVKPINLAASQVNQAAGFESDWNWQGFNVIYPPAAHDVINLVVAEVDKANL